MPVTDQDARALAYLAQRLRAEANATCWDEAGTLAVVSKLIGRDLAPSIERVTRHAADPEARTPAAIHRPFVPEASGPKPPANPTAETACRTCGKHVDRCGCDNPTKRITRTPMPPGFRAALNHQEEA